ncbi:mediator of RNA polymerase II transcription subunit 12-like isoform X1 [Cucumis melo var. makuwa]|uniref:Mediator of RNA polymerase II transcription subunit 12-like isoform X1 n=1 Tax=Cucumis melo var. makuwa TaxID=1194695 RepID=A0A5A7SLF8_CUCMM|nr:mediator of RNA polymerase II transcription subunit 12-like isoform X1 [Cucumis melo var. makuwa]
MAIGVLIQQFDIDVTQEYIHSYNITRLYITQLGATRSNNARLRDVADDSQQVLDICNNNKRHMEEIHNMYHLPIVPPQIHRGRVQVEEAELDEVYHNVEEMTPTTQKQNQTGYGSPMIMMPTFGVGYCDFEVNTEYYDSGVGPSSSYMDVGPSTSYMHGHRHDYGEHNEYLYHEAPTEVSDRQEYQQEPENQEELEQHRVQSRH